MNLQEAEIFLEKTILPCLRKKPKTFLDIAKQPHYENTCSNIYAFFLNPTEEHQLGGLFIKCLSELISSKKNGHFYFSPDFQVETEVGTLNKGRIDILLSNSKEAIIIENKIYHYLNNDLNDYWNSISSPYKQGIVLSLHKINYIPHQGFINITHIELLECVIKNLSAEFLDIPEKYLIFLKDFYQNIINLTNPMEEKIIKFYWYHTEQINYLKRMREQFVNHVIAEVEHSREEIKEKLEPYNNKNEKFRYFLCPEEKNLMITIAFEELFKGNKKIYLIVELQNELLVRRNEIPQNIFDETEKKYLRENFYSQSKNWGHFAIDCKEISEDQLMNLSSYLSTHINQSPILSIYKKLKQVLVNKP